MIYERVTAPILLESEQKTLTDVKPLSCAKLRS